MNLLALIFFTLFVIYISFGMSLQLVSQLNKTKVGLIYLYLSFYSRAFLLLGPASLLFLDDISWSLYTSGPLKVLMLPLLYLYFKKLHSSDKSLHRRDIVHFIPFIFEVIFTLSIVLNYGQEIIGASKAEIPSLLNIFWEDHFFYNILALTARTIAFFQSIIYAYLISKDYQKIKAEFLSHNSYVSYINLNWIKWVSFILIINGLVSGFELFGLYSNPAVFIFMALFILFNAFFFLIHSILHKNLNPNEENEISNLEFESKEKSFQDQDVLMTLNLIKDKEIYLKPDLSLQEASCSLGIAKYKLSHYIKLGGYDNFYHFINHLRIDKSKELLENIQANHSIDSIVNEAGFNSRATFYRVFKEYCKMTPSEFIKRNLKK